MVGQFSCPEEVNPTKDFTIRLIIIHYHDADHQIHVDDDGHDDDDDHYNNDKIIIMFMMKMIVIMK